MKENRKTEMEKKKDLYSSCTDTFLLFPSKTAPLHVIEFGNTWIYFASCVHIYSKLSANARASRGGSLNKSKELKTRMKIVNKMSDLQGSAYRLTSVIPSSWLVLEDASSN